MPRNQNTTKKQYQNLAMIIGLILVCAVAAIVISMLMGSYRSVSKASEDLYGLTPERQKIYDSLRTGESPPPPLSKSEQELIFKSLNAK